jgi:DNA-binding HxlR family transcriptional regulator
MGRTLIEPAVTLAEWAIEHNPDIERSHQAYDSGETPKGLRT